MTLRILSSPQPMALTSADKSVLPVRVLEPTPVMPEVDKQVRAEDVTRATRGATPGIGLIIPPCGRHRAPITATQAPHPRRGVARRPTTVHPTVLDGATVECDVMKRYQGDRRFKTFGPLHVRIAQALYDLYRGTDQ